MYIEYESTKPKSKFAVVSLSYPDRDKFQRHVTLHVRYTNLLLQLTTTKAFNYSLLLSQFNIEMGPGHLMPYGCKSSCLRGRHFSQPTQYEPSHQIEHQSSFDIKFLSDIVFFRFEQ